MADKKTCETCKFRTDRCCKFGDIVADFMKSSLVGHVSGINLETTFDYYRDACNEYQEN